MRFRTHSNQNIDNSWTFSNIVISLIIPSVKFIHLNHNKQSNFMKKKQTSVALFLFPLTFTLIIDRIYFQFR